ncbi:hypothetical protein ABID19_000516 [Mesorhizobium robiniae]|uniref:Uncharacterized protein n=1 Tax=Mesorhizobium robiniae TaxID=559315 RepID=A0ABV2GGT6_9HYPH
MELAGSEDWRGTTLLTAAVERIVTLLRAAA